MLDANLIGVDDNGMVTFTCVPYRECKIVSEIEMQIPDADPWYGMLDTGFTCYSLSCGHNTYDWSWRQPKYCSECGAKIVD